VNVADPSGHLIRIEAAAADRRYAAIANGALRCEHDIWPHRAGITAPLGRAVAKPMIHGHCLGGDALPFAYR
jgi:hypothetical protein